MSNSKNIYAAVDYMGVWCDDDGLDCGSLAFLKAMNKNFRPQEITTTNPEELKMWVSSAADARVEFCRAIRKITEQQLQRGDLPPGARAFWTSVIPLYS